MCHKVSFLWAHSYEQWKMRMLREKSQICVCVLSLKLILVFKRWIFWFYSKYFFFLGNSGWRLCSFWVACGFIVLCWRKYERYEHLCLGAEQSKLIRAIKLLWPNLFRVFSVSTPNPPQNYTEAEYLLWFIRILAEE